jgi:two-component system response regulator YesN
MFKVMIIDDEPMIRKGIRTMVNWKEHDCEVADEASDGVEGIEKIKAACLISLLQTSGCLKWTASP